MYEWSKMSIGILGAGIENIALAKFLLENESKVIVYDQGESQKLAGKLDDIDSPNLMIVGGKDYGEMLSYHDIFFRSPGMPLEYAKKITDGKGKLSSAMQLFFELCPAKIIGVTGTKGKGTTAALITDILERNLKSKVYLVGNIGKAPFDILKDLKSQDWVVVELSSFQLEDMTISPHISVILNITPDHIAPLSVSNPNFHKSFEDYARAKRKIVEFQKGSDSAVLAMQNDLSQGFMNNTLAQIYRTGEKMTDSSYVLNDKIWLNDGGKEFEIMDDSEVNLPGRHNMSNVLAAVMAAHLVGANPDEIRDGVKNFKGLPHRLQLVREVNGIKYYDDSYATGPDSVIAAIKSFNNSIVLICGGSSKGADFNNMALNIKDSKVKAAVVIGEESENILKSFESTGVDIPLKENLKTMEEMVGAANIFAKAGDIVLLSPGCASFGLFNSATDRGDQFQKIVNKIS